MGNDRDRRERERERERESLVVSLPLFLFLTLMRYFLAGAVVCIAHEMKVMCSSDLCIDGQFFVQRFQAERSWFTSEECYTRTSILNNKTCHLPDITIMDF